MSMTSGASLKRVVEWDVWPYNCGEGDDDDGDGGGHGGGSVGSSSEVQRWCMSIV